MIDVYCWLDLFVCLLVLRYVECSALTQEGLHQVFEEVLAVFVRSTEEAPKEKRCLLQ